MSHLELLKLLADDTRTKIIVLLKEGEVCVCNLAEKLEIEQSLLSHHLQKLKQADMVIERKVGRWVHYSLNIPTFKTMEDYYLQTFGSNGINQKKCELHPECCN